MTPDAWLVLASAAVAFILGFVAAHTKFVGVTTRVVVGAVGVVSLAILVVLVTQGFTAMSIAAFSTAFVVTRLVAGPRGTKGNQHTD